MKCPKCKANLPADAAFCPECGTNPRTLTAPAQSEMTGDKWGEFKTIDFQESSPERPALEPGTRFANRYDIVRKLGSGGMGVVYVATDSTTGEEIVLKLIHPELATNKARVDQLISEGLTARKIHHANIVAVHDVAQWEGQPYFTMEFVRGQSLRSWLGRKAKTDISLPAAAGVISEILDGLEEAHRMGFVHRDLKPENVMLCGDPDAGQFDLKILDFGIAKAVGARGAGNAPAEQTGPVGTLGYMAPEQETAADAAGPSADLYSLSVMFYEMLMESRPQARWESVSKARPDVPEAIDTLLHKGLSGRARSRQASVGEYREELAQALQGSSGQVDPVRPEPKRPEPRRPDPPPASGPGFFASLPAKTKLWAAGIGAVFVIAAAQQSCPQTSDGVSPPALTFDGYWVANTGERLEVDWEEPNFEASGTLSPYGPVTLAGVVSRAGGAEFRLTSQRGDVLGGRCQSSVGNGQLHLNCELADSMRFGFAVNHPWH